MRAGDGRQGRADRPPGGGRRGAGRGTADALPCGITFVVEGEEEIGSPHIAQFVLEHKDLLACNGAIWEQGYVDPSGRPINTLGAAACWRWSCGYRP